MRVVHFIDESGQVQVGKQLTEDTAQLMEADPMAIFPDPPVLLDEIVRVVQYMPPVDWGDLFCIGMNYRSHIEEMGGRVPDRPVVFMKPSGSVNAHRLPIQLPKVEHEDGEVDAEAELAVVIGKEAKDVSVDDALDYVLGYTCANDVSARWWQKQGGGGQFVRGKGFDTFCPLGPVLVTHGDGADQISDPQSLAIRGYRDDELMQEGHTRDMIFSVAELIAFLSQDTTLYPGAVILTGTPPGVGWAREPRKLLKAGMVSAVEIEKIGRLENPVKTNRS